MFPQQLALLLVAEGQEREEVGLEHGEGGEGASSETASSDHDSGKHSDNSLITSSEECWAEINKGSRHKHPWLLPK